MGNESLRIILALVIISQALTLTELTGHSYNGSQILGSSIDRTIIDTRNNFTICLTFGSFFGWYHLQGSRPLFGITSQGGLRDGDFNYDMGRVVFSGDGFISIYSIIPGSPPTFTQTPQKKIDGNSYTRVKWLLGTSYILVGLSDGRVGKYDTTSFSSPDASPIIINTGIRILQLKLRLDLDYFLVSQTDLKYLYCVFSPDLSISYQSEAVWKFLFFLKIGSIISLLQ